MQTHTLRNGLNLTRLGLGAAQLGNLYRETTEQEALDTVATAWDGGVRYFDTAPHYGIGVSERRVGALLSEYPRDEFVLSTKVGRILEPAPDRVGERDDQGFDVPVTHTRRWDFSRDGVLRSIEESLTRLELDRIDIAYLHDPDDHFEQASTEGIGALIELREQGVLRAVGAGMNAAAPLAELIRRADVDVVMCAGRVSLLDYSSRDELLPLAVERGVGIVAAGVYSSGILSRPRPAAGSTYDYQPAAAELINRANQIADIAERHGVSLPEVAIAFAARQPAVVSVVFGARGRAQVQSSLERAAVTIPDAVWHELQAAGIID